MDQTCLTSFKIWLENKSYSSSTIRNYLSDISRYTDKATGDIFSSDTVSSYLSILPKDKNYNRYLSSLSKFFQFALDQKLISIDPLKKARQIKKPSAQDILSSYQSHLNKKNFSPITIKNYINDIQQFIDWLKSNPIVQ